MWDLNIFDLSGALKYTQTQCEEGTRDVNNIWVPDKKYILYLLFYVEFELNNNIQVKESEQPGENENRIVVLNKKDEENGENFTG